MAIDPIKVPQNVQIADRIIGPVTLQQIIIVGVGAGISYMMYASISQAYGPPAIPVTAILWSPTAIAAFFAFFRINDISMFHLLLLMAERINKPATRIQTSRRGIVINLKTTPGPEKEVIAKKTHTDSSAIDELSTVLDSPLHARMSAIQEEAEAPAAVQNEPEEVERTPEETEHAAEPESAPNHTEDTSPSRLGVNPLKIRADVPAPEANGAEPHASVSIFRDISPSSSHE